MIHLVIFLVIYLFFSYFISRRQRGFNSFFVFSIFLFLYAFAIPIEMLVSGNTWFVSEPLVIMPKPPSIRQLNIILIMGSLALIGFGTGYYLTGFNPLKGIDLENKSDEKAPLGIIALLVLMAVICIGVYGRELIEISSYAKNVNLKANNALFNFAMYMFTLTASILLAYLISVRRISIVYTLLWSLAIISIGLYSKDKDPVLLGILPFGAYILRWKFFNHLSSQVTAMLSLFILIPFALYAFSVFRGDGSISLSVLLNKEGLYKTTDARGAMWVNTEYIDEDNFHPLYGKTYVKNAILWIPHYFYKDRPDDLAQEYAKTHRKELKAGEGLSYSLLAESYLNFGIIGALIQYLLLGLVWGYFWIFIRRYFYGDSPHLFNAIYLIYGYYMLTIMHRGPTNLIFTTFIQTLTPIVIFSLAFNNIRVRFFPRTN